MPPIVRILNDDCKCSCMLMRTFFSLSSLKMSAFLQDFPGLVTLLKQTDVGM